MGTVIGGWTMMMMTTLRERTAVGTGRSILPTAPHPPVGIAVVHGDAAYGGRRLGAVVVIMADGSGGLRRGREVESWGTALHCGSKPGGGHDRISSTGKRGGRGSVEDIHPAVLHLLRLLGGMILTHCPVGVLWRVEEIREGKGAGSGDGRSDTEGDTPSTLVKELWGSNGVGEEVGGGTMEGDGVVPMVVYLVWLTAVAIVVGSAMGTVQYMSDRATCPFGFKSSDPTNVDDPSPSSPQPPQLNLLFFHHLIQFQFHPHPTTNLLPRLPELYLPLLRRCHPEQYLQETGGDAA